jgi:hypothetical protein
MDIETIHQIRKKYPERITRGKAIKLYCLKNCCAGDINNWKNCSFKGCFLYNFRLGKEIGDIPKDKRIKDVPSMRLLEKKPI